MQNPKMINFRASSELVEVIGAAAKNAGVSVSEFLRGVVEDRLAEMTADEAPAEGVIDPFSLLSRAAKGSVQAQRALARSGVQMACSGQHDAQSCFREAMIFARLAAAHGGEITARNCPDGGTARTIRIPHRVLEAAA